MVNVHRYWVAVLDEYLAQERSSGLACFNVCVWHKEPFWSFGGAEPTCPEAFFFGGAKLNENEACSRDLGFDTTSKSLRIHGEYDDCLNRE